MTTFDSVWGSILDVGREPSTGGYRRYAWTTADLEMREWFIGEAQARSMSLDEDRNGNLWAWWIPPGWAGDPHGSFVTGSHLDSVPDGGAFDGPLGVVSAYTAVDILRARGITPRVPIGIVAFVDEEGARFGVACIGSQLSTGALRPERALRLRDHDGTTLADALRATGRNPEHLGPDQSLTDRIGVYVELHVEQGRALDLLGKPLAVASAIWPHGRWRLSICGEANHAGATRLVDRRDPMLPFASVVQSARHHADLHDSVATIGKVMVTPNGANAIPSRVDAWLDARAADESILRSLVDAIRASAHHYADGGGVRLEVEAESMTPIVVFPDATRQRLLGALARFGELPTLPTAAGHDVGILSAKVPSAMLFVRNPTGISHSPEEYAEISDCRIGAEALADAMIDWTAA